MHNGSVEGGAGRNRQREAMAALIDWMAFERLLGAIDAAPAGRRASGATQGLLLQQWYRLPDPELEDL